MMDRVFMFVRLNVSRGHMMSRGEGKRSVL